MTNSHPKTRKERKAATRQALKDASLECFAEFGYAETSIGAITQRAGVAHGTFYVHFPTKEAVLDELMSEFGQGLTARLAPVFVEVAQQPSQSHIRQLAQVLLDYWQQHRRFIESYAQRIAGGLNVVALRDGLTPQLVDALAAGLTAAADTVGEPVAHPQLVTQAFLGMWLRVGLQYLFNDQVSREAAVEVLERMTWGAAQALLPNLKYDSDSPTGDRNAEKEERNNDAA